MVTGGSGGSGELGGGLTVKNKSASLFVCRIIEKARFYKGLTWLFDQRGSI